MLSVRVSGCGRWAAVVVLGAGGVLGVAMDDEGWEIVKPYIEQQKINYRTLLGTEPVGALYGGVDSLPTSFMIDREGRIAAVHVGLVSKSVYVEDIKHLLEGGKNVGK